MLLVTPEIEGVLVMLCQPDADAALVLDCRTFVYVASLVSHHTRFDPGVRGVMFNAGIGTRLPIQRVGFSPLLL